MSLSSNLQYSTTLSKTARFSASLVAASILLSSFAGRAYGQEGAEVYSRCAACHQSSGTGIATIFPPLSTEPRLLAARPDGRRYLILAVLKGLSGPISVEGKTYRSVMPAHDALEDGDIAAVLTYVTNAWPNAAPLPKPFTADEVKAVRASGAALSAIDVAKLQPKLFSP